MGPGWRRAPVVLGVLADVVVGRVLEELLLGGEARRQEGRGRGGEAEVREDFLHDVGVRQEGEDDHGDATGEAGEGVDVEGAAQELGPAQAAWADGRRVGGGLGRGLPRGRRRGRESRAKARAIREDAAVADEVEVGRGEEGDEAAEQGVRLEVELGAALGVGPGLGQAVADAAVGDAE